MVLKCQYVNCSNSSVTHSVFRFPIRDENRLRIWINNSGNIMLTKLTPDELKNRHLCEIHFDKCYISYNINMNKLFGTAIPRHYQCVDESIAVRNSVALCKQPVQDSNLSPKPVDARRASKLCRFCGQFSEECVPVSPSYRTDDKTTLAFNNISIQIEFTDDLPDTICKDCDIKLQIMYDFVKVVQNAQESLKNVETEKIEDADEVDTGEFEMITVKTEYEEHEYDGSYDEGDGDDTNKESDDDEYDTKEGILDSLTLGETIFIKQNASHKRKSSRSSPEKSKKTKIGLENENTELIIDIKEEVSDGDDTNDNATSNTGCFINNEIKDVPSAKLIKRYVLCKTRSDGNS